MAKTKYPIPSPELIATDVCVSIYPRCWDCWEGTAEQLMAEGVIPEKLQWPQRAEYLRFDWAGMKCLLQRRRPPGSGRRAAWAQVNYWRLLRYSSHGGGTAELHEKRQALEREIWRHSAAGQAVLARYWVAYRDVQFQAFKRCMLGLSSAAHRP